MAERVRRVDDEKLYQPKIHSRHVRQLHKLKVADGRPMTVHLAEAIDTYYKTRAAQLEAGNSAHSAQSEISETPPSAPSARSQS